MPVNAVIRVVVGLLRIEEYSRRRGIDVIRDEICEIAGEFIFLAGRPGNDGEIEPIGLHGRDLAVLDALHRKTGIGEVATIRHAVAEVHGPGNAGDRDRRRADACELLDRGPVHVDDGRRSRLLLPAGGTGIIFHGDPRRLVGDAPARLGGHGRVELDAGDFDRIGGELRRIGLTGARSREAGDLHAQRRWRGQLGGDVCDRDGARQQVERHLAVARLAAGRTDLLKRGLDLAGDPMLHVALEAEETSRHDHDRGDQAHQDLYHSASSGC